MENIPHRTRSPFQYGETSARLTSSGGLAWPRLAAERLGLPGKLGRGRVGSGEAPTAQGSTRGDAAGGGAESGERWPVAERRGRFAFGWGFAPVAGFAPPRGISVASRGIAPGQLSADSRPWLLADNAYYCGEVVAFRRARGWDYTISVSHDRYRQPVLDMLPAAADFWESMDDPDERGVYVTHASAGWKRRMPAGWEGEDYLVIKRTVTPGGQCLLPPQHTVILSSRSDFAPQSVADVHRSKQGCENGWKGLLEDLGLHHPRCRALEANRAWACCAHLTHLLLRALQFEVLPESAHGCGIGTFIRRWMRSAARSVKARRPPTGCARRRAHASSMSSERTRAAVGIGLANLVYNFKRYLFLKAQIPGAG